MTSQELQPYCDKVLKYLYDKDNYQEYHYAATVFKDLGFSDQQIYQKIIDELWQQRPRKIDGKTGLIFPKIKINKSGIEYVERIHEGLATTYMTDEQKNQIIKLCEETINKKHNIRVGWAIEQVLGVDYRVQLHKTIALALSETGKYIFTTDPKRPNDFEVIKNPNYRESKWTEKNPLKYDIVKGAITAVFAITVSLLLGKSGFQENSRLYKQQQKQLEELTRVVDSLTKR